MPRAVAAIAGLGALLGAVMLAACGDTPVKQPARELSPDARFVAFDSDSPYLVAGDTNRSTDVFVRNLATAISERVSVSSEEEQANTKSDFGSISADGRYVAFESDASNLVSGDTNQTADVFVRDRVAGTTERVSVSSDGSEANGESFDVSMSADGHSVVFASFASNLVSDDTNGGDDVFVHDRIAGTTERVSVADGEEQSILGHGEGSYAPSLSADGRYVSFFSDAANLVPDDTNEERDVFVRDRVDGKTERVNVTSDGEQAVSISAGGSEWARVSGDGRFVVFESQAPNLVSGDTNGEFDLFLRDRADETTERISVSSDGTQGNDSSGGGWVSDDGRYVVFNSDASNLVSGDTNDAGDVFLRDRVAGTTDRLNVSSAGKQGNDDSYLGAMSTDDRHVAFESNASNLVPGDRNATGDVFIRDHIAGTTERVSVPLLRTTTGELVIRPDPPEAGRTLIGSMSVVVGDTRAASARVGCTASVAGTALRATSSSFRAGTAHCTWTVPVTSAGKVIKGAVRATTRTGSGARGFRAHIEAGGPRVEVTSYRHEGISPGGITVGPDGALWFTNEGSIGRITTGGAITIYRHPGIRSWDVITAGPDGALWFTQYDGNAIGRITTEGRVSLFRDKRVRYPVAITAGPDGALWFTMYSEEAMYNGDRNASGIGRITTDGKFTVYRDQNIDAPGGITAGPDGALWFTSYFYKFPETTVGRIATRGTAATVATVPSEIEGVSEPLGITTGPDRALWFTDPNGNAIGRITVDGKVRIFRDKSFDSPNAITVGPDGALWFTSGDSVGRITTSGTVSSYRNKSIRSPRGITIGPDGALWFANADGKSIGRLWVRPAG